jgi:hypothetical protein
MTIGQFVYVIVAVLCLTVMAVLCGIFVDRQMTHLTSPGLIYFFRFSSKVVCVLIFCYVIARLKQ